MGSWRQPAAARGSQRQPEAAKGRWRQPAATRGSQRQQRAASQRQPEAARGSQRQPEPARDSQSQPETAREPEATKPQYSKQNPRYPTVLPIPVSLFLTLIILSLEPPTKARRHMFICSLPHLSLQFHLLLWNTLVARPFLIPDTVGQRLIKVVCQRQQKLL